MYFSFITVDFLRFFVAGVRNFEVLDYIKLVLHGAGFAASIVINFNLGLPANLIVEILIIYLAAALVLAVATEIYLSIIPRFCSIT